LSGKTTQTLTLHSYGTNKQGGHITSAQIPRGLEVNSSRDDTILIFIVGYLCYSTITGGSYQHGAVVLLPVLLVCCSKWA